MDYYSVQITERVLGVAFALVSYDDIDKKENIAFNVIENSIGAKLGISVGDVLVSINGIPVEKIIESKLFPRSDIQYIFYHYQLPFTATLKKSEKKNKISIADLYLNRYLTTDTVIESTSDEDCDEDDAYTPSLDIYTPDIVIGNAKNAYANVDPLPSIFEFKQSIFEEEKSNVDIDELDEKDMKSDDKDGNVAVPKMPQLIAKHITQKVNENTDVEFDSISYLEDKICLLSSNGLNNGYFEWKIKIQKCDIYMQEIGVISVCNIKKNIKINNNRFILSKEFGAKAIYGSEVCTKSLFYGSFNSGGKERCYRDLKDNNWKKDDVVTVCLDLNKSKISFSLNGNRVRKAMSIETKDSLYFYPIIAFSGNSIYELVSFENKKWI